MRFSTLSVCPATGSTRFFERTVFYLIASAYTRCFHNKTTSSTYQLSDFFPARGTFLNGRIGHGLFSFEEQAAATAFIFIRGHNLCSLLFFKRFNYINHVLKKSLIFLPHKPIGQNGKCNPKTFL